MQIEKKRVEEGEANPMQGVNHYFFEFHDCIRVLEKEQQITVCDLDGLSHSKEELMERLKFKVDLQDVTIEPLFEKPRVEVHPAIDVKNGLAYIGVMLPTRVKTREGKEIIEKRPWLVRSDRRLIPCNKKALEKEGLEVTKTNVILPDRWSPDSIKAFLNGKASVDPQELFIAIKTILEMYIEFPCREDYDFMTLWIIGTYLIPCFNAYPYLYLLGMKGTGKTKTGNLLEHLCFNAELSTSITTSALFRSVEMTRGTFILDEEEKLDNPERRSDIHSILLSGYKRGGKVKRTNPYTFKVEFFEVFGAKVIANIKGLDDVLEDRCITLVMKRGKKQEILNREVPIEHESFQTIRNMLYLFFLTYYAEFSEDSEVSEDSGGHPRGVVGRYLELWKPILRLSKFFGGYVKGLHKRIIKYASKKIAEKKTENIIESPDYILVRTLLSLVKNDGFYKIKEIKDAMASRFEEEQKWLNAKWVGNALKRLGFTNKRAMARGTECYLSKKVVEDLARRLGVEPEEEELEPTIGDTLKMFRQAYPQTFNNVEFYHWFVDEHGFSPKEAEELLKNLKEKGEIFPTFEGVWRWS